LVKSTKPLTSSFFGPFIENGIVRDTHLMYHLLEAVSHVVSALCERLFDDFLKNTSSHCSASVLLTNLSTPFITLGGGSKASGCTSKGRSRHSMPV
jgi:hypothetical protein